MGSSCHFQALISITVLLGGLWACDSEEASRGHTPETSDCPSIEDWQDRLDCAYDKAILHVEDDAALTKELQTLSEAEDRDMVLYRLAFNHPSLAPQLCKKVTTKAFTEKCKQVLGRPHLGTTRKPSAPPPQPPKGTP